MDEQQFCKALQAWAGGDQSAADALYAAAYQELKDVARRSLRAYGRGDQLSTTLLVNECYLKLARSGGLAPETRQHYLALCARAMRQIIVDSARRQLADKRGGGALMTMSLDDMGALAGGTAVSLGPEAVTALEQALTDLERREPRLARIAECRIFSGMECNEIAHVLAVHERTVQREWLRVKSILMLVLGTLDEASE